MATTPSTQPQDSQQFPAPSPLKADLEGQAKESLEQKIEVEVDVMDLEGQAKPSLEQEIEVKVVDQEIEVEVEVVDFKGQAKRSLEQEVEVVDFEGQAKRLLEQEVEVVDFSKQAQWLHTAVLGANEGLLSMASLIMGVNALHKDVETMATTGVAGLIAWACSKAIGELVSVYSQYDIKVSQIKREDKNRALAAEEMGASKEKLPSPWQAAGASALAFAVGALVPLLVAVFIMDYKLRMEVVIGAVSVALVGFGGLSAMLGKAPVVKSASRVLLGGWLAMCMTFGLTKFINGP